MAKNNAKRSKTAEVSASNSHATPTFDENALSALTDKIERGLDTTKAPKQKVAAKEKKSPEKNRGENGTTPRHAISAAANGRKRDAQGNVKQKSDSKKHTNDRKKEKTPVDRAVLLQEILALGGTEDDLDLIADISSEEEEDVENHAHASSHDAKFAKELSKFVSGLGIEGQAGAEVDESENGEEEDGEEEEEQDDWEDEPGMSPKPPIVPAWAPAPKDEKRSDKVTKDPTRLTFEARPDWHAADLLDLPSPDMSEIASYRETITELKKYADSLLETDSNLYASKNLSSTSSHRFLATIMSSGTLSDKVSALTLVVQESPVHTTKSFESLLTLAKKRSRGQAVSALGALKDLLGSGVVLPADRRLRTFGNQPGLLGTLQTDVARNWRVGDPLPGDITKAHLISWVYEDWLKESYFEMLKVLEGWCNDEVEFARQRAVTYVYELLREKPEQESNLLRLLVNKLGDPEKKIASRTSYLILQLQTTHPLMKPIIIHAIENELLLRPNQSSHARYYAINTLNQTILSAKEEDVARKLLGIYFELFVALLRKPEPAKVASGPALNKKGQVQGGGGQKGKKAQEKATKEELAKLASEETTEKMISVVLTGVNRAFPFAGSDDATLEKHMDMLFKITHSSNFNTSIQALMLIQQLATTKNLAVERFYRTLYESLLDPRLLNSSKHALYLNLLFRALKSDLNAKRVKAFAKRLLQVITLHQPPFICGVLYLLRELEGIFPGLTSLLTDPEEQDEMDEEVFRDVPEANDDVLVNNKIPGDNHIHPDRLLGSVPKRENFYDGRKRDPEHSNADKSCLWELLPFLAHFHPSVSMFATRLLESSEMPAKPDLASHTLIHFLDRFVYRNAKAAASGLRGNSIMQPLAGGDSRGVLVSNKSTQSTEPVNSESFWRKKAEDVAVDEVFFHKYFSQIGKSKKASAKKAKHDKAADADEGDENEDEIWQALVDSRPEVEGPSDDDSDLEMLDLDDSEDGSSVDGGVDIQSEDGLDGDSDDYEDVDSEGSDGEGVIFGDDEDVDSDDEEQELSKLVETKSEKETSRSRKKRMKALPTFASADDYAEMLEQNDGEDF